MNVTLRYGVGYIGQEIKLRNTNILYQKNLLYKIEVEKKH